MRLITAQLDKYNKTIELLQDMWSGNLKDLEQLHHKQAGIRSTQVGALVMLLIELDIIK